MENTENNIGNNHEIEGKPKVTHGFGPFLWVFGGLTVFLIVAKLLMDLFMK